MQCYKCFSTTEETRPYGPNSAQVCFKCAFATPEAEKETDKNFEVQFMAAAKTGVVVIGEEIGPYPGRNHPEIADALVALGLVLTTPKPFNQ